MAEKLPADLGQVDTGAVTTEELGADLILDIPDAPADCRLLDTEVLRGAPEAAAFRSGDDVTHMA